MRRLRRVRPSTVILAVVAIVWLYPVVWTLTNALRSSADIYRAPLDLPLPPAFGNIGTAWERGQLGVALLNSAYVTAMTVALVVVLAVAGAYSLARLRPPYRAGLFILVLAPLIIPSEVLIVPLFSMFRALGLINSLPGLAVHDSVASVSFATVILTGYSRTIPQDFIDAAKSMGRAGSRFCFASSSRSRGQDRRRRAARRGPHLERLCRCARAHPEAGRVHGQPRSAASRRSMPPTRGSRSPAWPSRSCRPCCCSSSSSGISSPV